MSLLSAFSSGNKRARCASPTPGFGGERLCDGPDALDELFRDPLAARRAKVRGLIKNWSARELYEQLEEKLLRCIADATNHDDIDEEWVLDIVPELKDLEAETLASLLGQFVRHLRYEAAARDLRAHALASAERAHVAEIEQLRDEWATERQLERQSGAAQRKQADALAASKLKAVEERAASEMEEAQARVADLESELDQLTRQAEIEAERAERRECELENTLDVAAAKLRESEAETELKREASRMLKEEVIDNDKLTVANLNRIKTLEMQLGESARLVDALERENDELRRAVDDDELHHDANRLAGKKRGASLLDRFGIGSKLQALQATLAAQ